jgi:putative acetyltransferase
MSVAAADLPVSIGVEPALQDDVRALVSELTDAINAVVDRDMCHHLTPEDMAGPDTTVFVARVERRAVGMGALRRHAEIGEVKRMYTRPEAQGRGVGAAILAEIEGLARREKMNRLVLETSDRQPAAQRLYERAGFQRCGPFLGYAETPRSMFYEKMLAP